MKKRGKNPHAAALGRLGGKASMKGRSAEKREEFARLGGLAGGKARAKTLTKAERVAIAKKAAATRWGKKRIEPTSEEEDTAAVREDGTVRLTKLTPEQRSEIARKAGIARGRKKAD